MRAVVKRPAGIPGDQARKNPASTTATRSSPAAAPPGDVVSFRANEVGARRAMAYRRAEAMNSPGSACRGQVTEHSPQYWQSQSSLLATRWSERPSRA